MNWLCECIDPQLAAILEFRKSGDMLCFLAAAQWNCKCVRQDHVILKAPGNTITSANGHSIQTFFFFSDTLLSFYFNFFFFYILCVLLDEALVLRQIKLYFINI